MFSNPVFKRHACVCLWLAIMFSACTKINETSIAAGQQQSSATTASGMNVIIILADDIGYEVPTYTGGQSYSTPNMDMYAKSGMRFTHCYANAMCSPSRIMMLTGKYGIRNYHNWGILDTSQKTIANMLHDKGYATCVSGKWQLDGGKTSIRKFGFDEHSVFDPFEETDSLDVDENLHRYKNPTIYQNGSYLPASQTNGKYSDDIFTNYATGFIERNKSRNFFLYLSFSECHLPFTPPPNNPRYRSFDPLSDAGGNQYFPYMVSYMDSKINTIVQKVKDAGLYDKTYIFITADNGTEPRITSKYKGRKIAGGKRATTEFGVHVPLIVLGANVKAGSVNKNIVDLSDFMPTIATISGTTQASLTQYGILDGRSFYSQLTGPNIKGRDWSYCYYFPYPNNKAEKRIFVQDTTYKLYDRTNGNRFYNLQKDSLEKSPIPDSKLTANERAIKANFEKVLSGMHN